MFRHTRRTRIPGVTRSHSRMDAIMNHRTRAKGRFTTATMFAAGTLVAGTLNIPTANAEADQWVALAYSWQSSVNGFANNQPDSEAARFAAMRH